MASLLDIYSGPRARAAIVARWPEVGLAVDLLVALIMEHDAGRLDDAARRHAGRIADGVRRAVGYLQEVEAAALPIDECVALLRVKRGVRDADLLFPWPYTPSGSGSAVEVGGPAQEALVRLRAHDPILDWTATGPRYPGGKAGLLGDLRAVAEGTRVRRI